jgi:hypothetical protein
MGKNSQKPISSFLQLAFGGVFLLSFYSNYLFSEPFLELNELFENKEFVYEQVVSPPSLRKFFIPPALISFGVLPSVQWCNRIDGLLDRMSMPVYLHYVSPVYAAGTYRAIADMAHAIGLEPPLIFLADKNQHQSTKAIESLQLHGDFYGLIVNQSFIARRTGQQLRALVARELAMVAALRMKRGKRLSGLCSIGALCIGALFAYNHCSLSWFKKHALLLLGYSALLAGGAAVANWGDQALNKVSTRDINDLGVNAFGGSAQDYIVSLEVVSGEEQLRAQQQELYLCAYVFFILKKIEAISDLLTPYALCFLKNQLMLFSQHLMQKPASLKAGFSDAA